MTTTDIGILLVVLCILLWAVMAALHRHTVQLQALQAQLESLLKAQRHATPDATEHAAVPEPHDNGAPFASKGDALPAAKQHTLQD